VNHGIYICTKNREQDVLQFLASLVLNKAKFEVIIVDSTEPKSRWEAFSIQLSEFFPDIHITHFFHKGRLPSARNAGILLNKQHDLIHFFDDDVTIPNDYLVSIEKFLIENPGVMGGGPRIKGIFLPNDIKEKSLFKDLIRRYFNFRLKVRSYGKIGKNCKNHWVPDVEGAGHSVDWIPGCAMFYKPIIFKKYLFNSNLENGFLGYALGEDMEFSYRVSREFNLKSVGSTAIEHHLAPSPRSDREFIAGALGALTAHMYVMFPKNFSKTRIYFSKFLEFGVQSTLISDNKLKSFNMMFQSFSREFRKELRENNWKL
jgi:glycosyltransferase involved in cell wall biosynthesis